MTDWDRMLALIAIDAARNCIHIFEAEYPADEWPRRALETTEKWLNEPTSENRRSLEKPEIPLWRTKDWKHDQASLAAQACALAARAARHPLSSAIDAIECERCALGIDHGDYSRKWLRKVLNRYGSGIERVSDVRRAS